MTSGFIGIALNFIRSSFKNSQGSTDRANHLHPNGWEVWFEELGRSGRVGFKGEGHSFGMYWEFGGGDVVAIIDVPAAETWVIRTGISLEKRAAILTFIGSEAIRQKNAGRGSFEVQDACILIF